MDNLKETRTISRCISIILQEGISDNVLRRELTRHISSVAFCHIFHPDYYCLTRLYLLCSVVVG
jgi:hypothetical protein